MTLCFFFTPVFFFCQINFYVSLSQNDESSGITFECSPVISQCLVRLIKLEYNYNFH